MVNAVKYLIEIEGNVEGDIASIKNAGVTLAEGSELNSDQAGVSDIKVKSIKYSYVTSGECLDEDEKHPLEV